MFLVLTLVFDMHFASVQGILGGRVIEIEEAPYQLNYADICGAVLIHKKWALTTAHCGKEYYIRVGNKQRLRGSRIKIRSHIVHPKFRQLHLFDYDIQLLELFRKLRITNAIAPIEIGDNNYGDYIHIAGWGYQKEKGEYQNVLHQVKLGFVPMKKCQSYKQTWYNNTLTQRMFCAGGGWMEDACQGDSGGAAVSLNRLIGLASFGYGCGRNYPGVYLNVTGGDIREWIRNYTGV